jgi:hypothetical protein
MPSGDSGRVVRRKIDMGGYFEANRIYAPHTQAAVAARRTFPGFVETRWWIGGLRRSRP